MYVLVYTHIVHIHMYGPSCLPAQAGGGRNEVDPRFLSLFSTYNVTFPSMESLSHIYSSILAGHLQPFKKGVCRALYAYMNMHVHVCMRVHVRTCVCVCACVYMSARKVCIATTCPCTTSYSQ